MNQRGPFFKRQETVGPLQTFQNAIAFHGQRRLWEAEQLYKRALKVDDRHFGCLYHFGLLRLQQARFDDAVRLFRRAIDVEKNSAEAHHHLAVALMGVGRPEEAIQRYQKALTIRPDLAETHNNLGYALQTLDRTEDAIAHYEKAIEIQPDYAEAHNNLGNVIYKLGRSQEAIAHYEKALVTKPRYAEACNNLANVLVALGRLEEAIAYYEQALAIIPNDAEAHDHLGNTLHMLGRSEDAIPHHETAIAIKPKDAEFHSNLGQALHALGRLDDAKQAFDTALASTPGKARYYWMLANSKRFTPGDNQLIKMIELARDANSLPVEEQIGLHFALGKAFADVGDRHQSFQHLLQGNSLKRQQVAYDEARTLEEFERVRRVFTANLLRDTRGLGEPSSVPIFIVGLPRSGTTLVEQILASHQKVFGAGELIEVGRLTAAICGPDGSSFPEAVATMSGERLRQLGEIYLSTVRRMAPTAERVVDKMMSNFTYAGLIHLALPNARIIWTRRDPRDTALSCFSILFAKGLEYTYDLAELGRYYRGYHSLMRHWRAVLPKGAILEVHYEEVVESLEEQARRIVAHCGLEWDERCLSFHKTARSVRTASATQVRQPIYRSSVGRWRPYEHLLQPLLQALEGV